MIGTIGENMTLRRTAYLDVKKGAVASYIHNQMAPGLGKIGVIVALESTGDADALKSFGRQVAMHIAAANPQAVDVESLDQAVVERERAVLSEQAKEFGKPANVIEKMVEGRMRQQHDVLVELRRRPSTIFSMTLAGLPDFFACSVNTARSRSTKAWSRLSTSTACGLAAAICMATWLAEGLERSASPVDSSATMTPILPRPGAIWLCM